ncbi:regulatory protein RecX [Chloroflexota bacterium]
MREVTNLRIGRGRGKRVNVFLDGEFAFSLQAETAAKEGLQVGQQLSANRVEALARSDQFHRCINAATRYLSYRPRSEAEIKNRLQRHGFNGDSIEAALAKLREQGLLGDVAFAQFWKDSRESFSPRSQWLTKQELRQKGVVDEIIDQVVGEIDDTDNAYRAALSKARRLPLSDYQDFRRRLGEYLRRRGFNYGVINHTLERVWEECGSSSR